MDNYILYVGEKMNNKEWKKWIFWFTFAVASIVVFKTIDSVSEIMTMLNNFLKIIMPFIMAALVSYILYIPCTKIEKTLSKIKQRKVKRLISVILVYIISALIIFIIFKFVVPSVSESITDLGKNIPNYFSSAINYFNNLDEENILYKLHVVDYVKTLQKYDIGESIVNWINIENIAQSLKGIVGATNVIFDLFVTIVVSFYLLLERGEIKEFVARLLNVVFDDKANTLFSNYYHKTNGIFFNFITSQLLDAFVVGIITSIVMSIMHIKYAVLLGFLIGLFNIIPYFGAIVAVIIAVVITIFTGGLTQALWLALVIVILQQIDANIINPRILGASLNLSPILVIFAVTVGGSYFGLLGMFLGVPVMALLKIIISDFIEYRNRKKQKNDYIERE